MNSNYLKAVSKLAAIKVASLRDYVPTEDEAPPSQWGHALGTTAGAAAFAPFYLKGGFEWTKARGLNPLHPLQATFSLGRKLNPWGTGEVALASSLAGDRAVRMEYLKRLQARTPSLKGIPLDDLYEQMFKERRNWFKPGWFRNSGAQKPTITVPTRNLRKITRASTHVRLPKLGKKLFTMGKGRLGVGLAAAGLASYIGNKIGDKL